MPGGMRNAKRRNGDGNPACTRQAEASRELHVTTAGEPDALKGASPVRTGGRPLPRVPANPRVRNGELRGIHAVWADPAPGFVRTAGQLRPCFRRNGVPPGFSLPPLPDHPLPDGQVKGALRASLRDRCATPDLPVRSQGRQLSGSGRKAGLMPSAPGGRLHGSPGLQDSQFWR